MSFKSASSNSKVKPIFYALESNNYKRVGFLIKDLLKEQPNNVNYQLIKNYCNIIINNDYNIETTLSIMNNLQNYNELIKFENLELILEILKISNYENCGKIFEVILKKQPSNLSLIKYWNKYSLENLNLSSLQKSSLQLSKIDNVSSPAEKRKLVLTSCFNYYLISLNDLKIDALHKKLYSRLALKLLSGTEPLKSDQEYFLKFKLLQIDNNTGNQESLISIMDDQLLKKKKITEIDITLVLMYLQTLKDLQSFERLYKFTDECIFENQINDYNFWNFCLLSSFKLNKQDELLKRILKFYNAENDRNVLLTLINHSILRRSVTDIKRYLLQYFNGFGNKKVCFVDLKKILQFLITERKLSDLLDWFILEITTYINEKLISTTVDQIFKDEINDKQGKLDINQVTLLINLQKFKMLDILMKNDRSKDKIEKILTENLKIFNCCFRRFLVHNKESMKNDYFIGNELLLMNLTLELQTAASSQYLHVLVLKYFVLLKFVLTFSPEDFLIKLWLMILQNYLNLPLLTVDIFKSLSIKNVQIDTLNYLLSIRISSRYPNLEKNSSILSHMEFYNKEYTMEYLVSVLRSCYENQSFTKIEKYFEFLNMLIHSYERWSSTFEIVQSNLIMKSSNQLNKFQKINNDYRNLIKMNFMTDLNKESRPNKNEENDFERLLTFNTDGILRGKESSIVFENDTLTFGYSDNRDFKSLWGSLPTILEDENKAKSSIALLLTGPIPKENYLKLQNLKLRILQEQEIVNLKNIRLCKFFENYCKILESKRFRIDEEFTEVEALEIQLFFNLWNFSMNIDHIECMNKVNDIILKLTSSFVDLIDPEHKWINWSFTHKFITIINVSNNFKSQYKLLKANLRSNNDKDNEMKIQEIEQNYTKLADVIMQTLKDGNCLKSMYNDDFKHLKAYLNTDDSLSSLLKDLGVPDSFVADIISILQKQNTEMCTMMNSLK